MKRTFIEPNINELSNTTASMLEKLDFSKQKYSVECDGNSLIVEFPDDEILLTNLSFALAEFLSSNYEFTFTNKILRRNFNELEKFDQKKLQHYFAHYSENNDNVLDHLMLQRRKICIATELIKCIKSDELIDLKGFSQFRLNEYQKLLNEFVSNKVEQYLEEKQYAEFINLLQWYVETNAEIKKQVDIIFYPSERYSLFSEDVAYTDKCCFELTNDLIELLPEHIVLHNHDLYCSASLSRLIQSIFGDKISYCNGCNKCLQ